MSRPKTPQVVDREGPIMVPAASIPVEQIWKRTRKLHKMGTDPTVSTISLRETAMIMPQPISITRPPAAPIEFAGQWVAWNRQQSEIVAHGVDVAVVRAAAIAASHPDAILEKVRHAGTTFIGAA